MTSVRCSAQRLLNPYRGVLYSITTDSGQAQTRDGRQWQLYIAIPGGYQLRDFDGLTTVNSPTIKFGHWSLAEGLQRAPRLSRLDYAVVERAGEGLLQAIETHARELPFALDEPYELWRVDVDARPLVLLESQHHRPQAQSPAMSRWDSGRACREHFADTRLCQELEQAIKGHSHPRQPLRWYRRQDSQLIPLDDNTPAVVPPPCLLREAWGNPGLDRQIRQYLDWQAPLLLMLEGLSHDTRMRLEQAAAARADLTARLCGLYPEICDPTRMKAIRVQAQLEQADK